MSVDAAVRFAIHLGEPGLLGETYLAVGRRDPGPPGADGRAS
ncbi:hypothetical protein [Actinoplanes sp. NPDC051411]